MHDLLKKKIALIPKKPGCYLWKNVAGDVIYVGKAKNLYNRTHQYFERTQNLKTNSLVKEIFDVDYFVVSNANEALILENNLIKKYYPKYNIVLKDSSEYPYIVITDGNEPQVLYTRRIKNIKGKFYGPLADANLDKYELYKFINEISPFPKKGILNDQKSLFEQIYMSINNQPEKLVTKQFLYDEFKKFVDDLFHGKVTIVLKQLEKMEANAVSRWDFEHAEKYKNLSFAIQNLCTSQIVQLMKKTHADFFCFYQENELLSINIFNYLDGKLLAKHNSIHKIYIDINETISSAIVQYYNVNLLPSEVIVSLKDEQLNELKETFKINFSAPNSTINKKIMNIGLENAKIYFKNNKLSWARKYDLTIGACQELSNILQIPKANYIEVFDNSNINLQHSVSAMVCFKNGVPSKNDYRKFNLETNDIKSDFHFMKEVIYRRYSRLLENKVVLPDLIIVDGGIIQINAALSSLNELGIKSIPLIGLKKDDHHNTNCIVLASGDEKYLDKKSPAFLFLKNLQDEVHRYAISFYRSKHLKNFLQSQFDEIPGIGKATINKLSNYYSTIDEIKNASLEELIQLVPKKIALKLKGR